MWRMISVIVGFMVLSGCSYKRIFSTDTIKQLEKEVFISQMEADSAFYLIDIRTPAEHKKGHLKNSINISYFGTNFKKKVLKLDNNKTVYLHCETAHRSPFAVKKLKRLGFTRIYDLKGGYRVLREKD